MHGIHASLARRLEALARRLGAVPETESPDQTARRLVLVRAALAGETPRHLEDGERVTFPKIVASVPILQELRHEGIVGPDGEPAGGDDYPHHEDGDGDGQELVWVP